MKAVILSVPVSSGVYKDSFLSLNGCRYHDKEAMYQDIEQCFHPNNKASADLVEQSETLSILTDNLNCGFFEPVSAYLFVTVYLRPIPELSAKEEAGLKAQACLWVMSDHPFFGDEVSDEAWAQWYDLVQSDEVDLSERDENGNLLYVAIERYENDDLACVLDEMYQFAKEVERSLSDRRMY